MNEQQWGLQQAFMYMHEQGMVEQEWDKPTSDQPRRFLTSIRRVLLSWRQPAKLNPSTSPDIQFAEALAAD